MSTRNRIILALQVLVIAGLAIVLAVRFGGLSWVTGQ